MTNLFEAYVMALLVCLWSNGSVRAGEKFTWVPITDADRIVVQDSGKGIVDAVMLFERILVDDRELSTGDAYIDTYRRVKVFTIEGRKWAEVNIPYSEKMEVEEVRARTVLSNGREIEMSEEAIHETEVLKTESVRVKQISFSLPEVTDGSIIEYRYRQRKPAGRSVWLFQKEIPLMHGEYRWRLAPASKRSYLWYYAFAFNPNYLWLNCEKTGDVEFLPSKKDPQELVFTILYTPAFNIEPHAIAKGSVLGQLCCYYSDESHPMTFWGNVAGNVNDRIDIMLRKKGDLDKIVSGFIGSAQRRVDSAYTWVQENIKNTSLMTDKDDIEDSRNVEEILERKYGSPYDINLVFHAMVAEMGIDSRMIYAVDHSDTRFFPEVKYWQFDESLVSVSPTGDQPYYYAPGSPYMPPRLVPWFIEGTQGLAARNPNQIFAYLPPSPAWSNSTTRTVSLRVGGDLSLLGVATELLNGHAARDVRLKLCTESASSQSALIENEWTSTFADALVDSFTATGVDVISEPLLLSTHVSFPPLQRAPDGRVLLQPMMLFTRPENPFTAERRSYAIVMDYAKVRTDHVSIKLPAGWSIESLPAPVAFENDVGRVDAKMSVQGAQLEVERTLLLKLAFWPETNYSAVRNLFQQYEDATDLAVLILTK